MIEPSSDVQLDLRGVLCPINFVRIKLQLEEMENDKLLEVILDDGEPMRNVPRSLKEEGHQIIRVEKLESGKYYRLWIKKQNQERKDQVNIKL